MNSLKNQDTEIFIEYVKYNSSCNGYNKSKMLNNIINNCCKNDEYVNISDVDIIWPENTIWIMEKYIKNEIKPFRLLPYLVDKTNPLKNGLTDGIGLIHIPSVLKIGGFDEQFQNYGPESIDLNRRLKTFGDIIIECKNIIVEHQDHELNNRSTLQENTKYFEGKFNV
jgi:hypothetical protein